MSAKHTPGPWIEDRSGVIGSNGEQVLIANCGLGFASAYEHPERTANGRLIMAAPELLEVLREIIADGMHCDVVPHLHRKAMAVIAKATVEQP